MCVGVSVDLASIFDAVENSVLTSTTPMEAWSLIVAIVDATGYAVPKVLREYDITPLVAGLAQRLQSVAIAEPPPPGLTFYHLGLFDTGDPSTATETVGVYLAAGTGDPTQSLSRGELAYRPRGAVLESGFLNTIRAAALDLGAARNVFEYGLLLGAAAVLARFAIEAKEGVGAVTVGFDGGDYMVLHRDRDALI